MNEENLDGAKLVASAIAGLDYHYVVVNDKSYVLPPPTIARIAGACYWLTELGEGETVHAILSSLKNVEHLARALSWFIEGNDSLYEELAQGSLTEVVAAIEEALSMIDVTNFIQLSVLQRSAKMLIAKPK